MTVAAFQGLDLLATAVVWLDAYHSHNTPAEFRECPHCEPERAQTIKLPPPALVVTTHELCTCGHCRCAHAMGFAACVGSCPRACQRYTWPGPNSELRADHADSQETR